MPAASRTRVGYHWIALSGQPWRSISYGFLPSCLFQEATQELARAAVMDRTSSLLCVSLQATFWQLRGNQTASCWLRL